MHTALLVGAEPSFSGRVLADDHHRSSLQCARSAPRCHLCQRPSSLSTSKQVGNWTQLAGRRTRAPRPRRGQPAHAGADQVCLLAADMSLSDVLYQSNSEKRWTCRSSPHFPKQQPRFDFFRNPRFKLSRMVMPILGQARSVFA